MALYSTDRYPDIEVEGELGHQRKRSQYSVRLSLADNAVARSTHLERRSLVLKWEWNAKNQMCVGHVIDPLIDVHLLESARSSRHQR